MKGSVRFLINLVYNDRRTLTGRTVTKIANDCSIDRSVLNCNNVKKLSYFPAPESERWRLAFLKELIDVKDDKAQVEGISKEEIDEIIDEICTN